MLFERVPLLSDLPTVARNVKLYGRMTDKFLCFGKYSALIVLFVEKNIFGG